MSYSVSVNRPWIESLEWLTRSLARDGMRLMRTFDLHDARMGASACPCPRHGMEACTCQMVVVLIYGQSGRPSSLVLHGDEEQTWFSLVNNPLQPADPAVRSAIERALREALEE